MTRPQGIYSSNIFLQVSEPPYNTLTQCMFYLKYIYSMQQWNVAHLLFIRENKQSQHPRAFTKM